MVSQSFVSAFQMDFFNDITNYLAPIFKNIWVQIGLLIVFATGHGYAGAWLAVRMLFRPRLPVKLLGITVFPQGMIPRHRDRLANAIGKAVGEELVSKDTIIEQLTGNDFLRKKIQNVVDSYTSEILSEDYPSLIEALPKNVREPVLDAISALQLKLGEHIRSVLKSEESLETIRGFVTRRVDDVLGKRVSEVVDDEAFGKITGFLDERVRTAVKSKALETNIRDFISRRIDALINSETPLGMMFTDDAVALLKEKANEQIEPAIRQIADIAATEKTRNQISSLIKHEVHDYYENLSFFKKIFVSRETLIGEVDDLVNESLPKRIEDALSGAFFVEEARAFIGTSIDNAMAKPLPVVIGGLGFPVVFNNMIQNFVTNRARTFVYSTAPSPASSAASLEAVAIAEADDSRRRRLWQNVKYLRQKLKALGFEVPGEGPIAPVILGDTHRTMQLAERLFEKGILAPGIRPPTVPKGTDRIRLTVSALHTPEQIDALADILRKSA